MLECGNMILSFRWVIVFTQNIDLFLINEPLVTSGKQWNEELIFGDVITFLVILQRMCMAG